MKYQIEPQDLINKVKSLIKGETNQEPHPNP
jgi:hypothetical protein